MNVELEVGMDVSGLYVNGDEESTILEVLPNLEKDDYERTKYPFVVKKESNADYGYKSIIFHSYTKEGIFNISSPNDWNIKRRVPND